MSILVKGMEMPKDCVYCKWHTRWGCGITGIRTNTAQGCPLIEVPTPHGQLIDADELLKWADVIPLTWDGGVDINDLEQYLKTAPSIIEAEEDSHE